MSLWITDPWTGAGASFADTVHVEDRPEASRLLGPDGRPLCRPPVPVGFDTRPARPVRGDRT